MDKSSRSKTVLSVQAIVLLEVAWAVATLLFYLLFSVPSGKNPFWYEVGITVFEVGAFFFAALLCFRNWRSPQIVSGRNVWLGIGLGMLCYSLGNVLFFYWETILGRKADVSPGDFFYVFTYIFLILGMVAAVISRRLNLEIWQWGLVSVVVAVGIGIAVMVSQASESAATTTQLWWMEPAVAQAAPSTSKPLPSQPKPAVKAAPAKATPAVKATPSPTPVPVKSPEAAPKDPDAETPTWVRQVEGILRPLKKPLDWYYIISDLLLLTIATTLLLAFWGGRFSQSWRMIAAAAVCMYLADIWFKFASAQPDYQSGSLLEAFWTFSAVLFGIGAALEHDLSSRSRSRSGSRRRAAS